MHNNNTASPGTPGAEPLMLAPTDNSKAGVFSAYWILIRTRSSSRQAKTTKEECVNRLRAEAKAKNRAPPVVWEIGTAI
jgi:hypothetical protein